MSKLPQNLKSSLLEALERSNFKLVDKLVNEAAQIDKRWLALIASSKQVAEIDDGLQLDWKSRVEPHKRLNKVLTIHNFIRKGIILGIFSSLAYTSGFLKALIHQLTFSLFRFGSDAFFHYLGSVDSSDKETFPDEQLQVLEKAVNLLCSNLNLKKIKLFPSSRAATYSVSATNGPHIYISKSVLKSLLSKNPEFKKEGLAVLAHELGHLDANVNLEESFIKDFLNVLFLSANDFSYIPKAAATFMVYMAQYLGIRKEEEWDADDFTSHISGNLDIYLGRYLLRQGVLTLIYQDNPIEESYKDSLFKFHPPLPQRILSLYEAHKSGHASVKDLTQAAQLDKPDFASIPIAAPCA